MFVCLLFFSFLFFNEARKQPRASDLHLLWRHSSESPVFRLFFFSILLKLSFGSDREDQKLYSGLISLALISNLNLFARLRFQPSTSSLWLGTDDSFGRALCLIIPRPIFIGYSKTRTIICASLVFVRNHLFLANRLRCSKTMT